MSLFRRPTDDSSTSSSSAEDSDLEEDEDEQLDQSRDSGHASSGTEEAVGPDLTRTETLSTNEFSMSEFEDPNPFLNADRHRNLMLAALLEEFYRTKAAEMINKAHPGANYTRSSPEVQELAQGLFSQASQTLAGAGLLPADTLAEEQQTLRRTYVTGLDNITMSQAVNAELISTREARRLSAEVAAGSMALVRRGSHQPLPFTNAADSQINQLAYETNNISLMPRPSTDLRFFSSPSARISHYHSTFEEKGLLGRGGFGRVYHTYNIFDRREYAVKKIPLSPKLSQRYRQGGHQELSTILREVQALAKLDHCNVVRYYATWIEEPTGHISPSSLPPTSIGQRLSPRNQRLLENRPANRHTSMSHPFADRFSVVNDHFSEDFFDRDGAEGEEARGPEWSIHRESHHSPSSSAVPESDIFSDGHAQANTSRERHLDDPSVYVLHVQMSMYPMTLSQYLTPAGSPRSKSSSSLNTSSFRHCFHLVPALRILLSILCGLQYIHANGLIHRDIKPSNIFITALDRGSPVALMEGFANVGSCMSCPEKSARFVNPRIGDFGLVAELERAAAIGSRDASPNTHSRSDSGSMKAVGTEYYRPPTWNQYGSESLHGQAFRAPATDEKLDMFALGVVLVELLWCCGTRMERIDLLQGCQKGRVPVTLKEKLRQEGHDEDIAMQVEACIHGMIDPDPERRWGSSLVKDAAETILSSCSRRNEASSAGDANGHQGYAEEVD